MMLYISTVVLYFSSILEVLTYPGKTSKSLIQAFSSVWGRGSRNNHKEQEV